jgi:hypothetical protein
MNKELLMKKLEAEQRREEIQGIKNGCLEWVRKQVAREKDRRAA